MPATHFANADADDRSPSRFRRATPFTRIPQRVPGEGPQPCRCMLIGERPGYEESVHRPTPRPFVGISGKYLDLCLQAAAIERSTLYITNLVKSYLNYQKPTVADIADDHEELVSEVVNCDPEIIGLVGAWSVEHVLNRTKAEMEKCHGVPTRATELFDGELTGSWIILPIIHPASAVYAPDSLSFVLSDILTLGELLDGEIGIVSETVHETDYRVVNADDLDAILP